MAAPEHEAKMAEAPKSEEEANVSKKSAAKIFSSEDICEFVKKSELFDLEGLQGLK